MINLKHKLTKKGKKGSAHKTKTVWETIKELEWTMH